MFWKKKDQTKVALTVVADGKSRPVTYEELALSNNLSQEALVRLMVEKKLIDPQDLLTMMETVRKERYRTSADGK